MTRLFFCCAFYLLLATRALAGVSCVLPFTLTNGTLADATQVMANYNALVVCLNLAASAGVNSDITALSGLTTPLAVSEGGTSTFIGGTSTGSANAQIVATTTPNTFQLVTGYRVIFKAGFTNTGPTTVNAGGQGALNVFRQGVDGINATVGGEIVSGMVTELVYDGTQFQILNSVVPFPVGTVLDTIAATADPGFILMQGQCTSTTTLAVLWAKMGSPVPGGCAAGQFALPDGRGRVVAMIDSGGSGRITVAGGNFNGTVLYGAGGAQNQTVARTALPNVDLFTVDGAQLTIPDPTSGLGTIVFHEASGLGGVYNFGAGSNGNIIGTLGLSGHIYLNGNVGQTALPTLQPTLMLNKQIKY